MSDQIRVVPDASQEPAADAPALTPVQQRIADWQEARKVVPTMDDIRGLDTTAKTAERDLEVACVRWREAVVRRALVHGYSVVAEEVGVSAKMIHAWRARHVPDAPDLSSVITREMPAENRRIERAMAKLAEAQAHQVEMEAMQARVRAAMKAAGR